MNANGSCYFSGATSSAFGSAACSSPTNSYFPYCQNSNYFFQPSFGGGRYDGFIGYFDNSNNDDALNWSTYFGGNGPSPDGQEIINALSIYKSSNNEYLYFSGYSDSYQAYPLVDDATDRMFYQSTLNSATDAVIGRFVLPTTVVGIDELSTKNKEQINIFPNPATDGFYIELNKSIHTDHIHLTIFNSMGQVIVNENEINQNKYYVSCENWVSGIYLFQIYANGNILNYKVIKK